MHIQAEDKNQFMDYLKDFQSKVVNEDLMIAHKMLGPNFESQLSELYPKYCKAFAGQVDLNEVHYSITKSLFHLTIIFRFSF